MYCDFYTADQISQKGYSIKQLIMAALLRADLTNTYIIKKAYPKIYEEFNARKDSPDGFITERERTVYGDPGEDE